MIDGQQRLTTLQLLLDAAQEVFEQLVGGAEARRLSRLVLNDEDFVGGDADQAFKIWPTNVDRDAFRHAMRNELSTEKHEESLIVQAHEFFKLQIREWLNESPSSAEQRAHALEVALIALLQMVVIDLEHNDDAHVIFETLNARGTPLLASDLIKNFVLHESRQSGGDANALYEAHLQPFDAAWWREDVRQGRIVRPRVDVFLNYWLVMRMRDEVPASEVFPVFRRYADEHVGPIEAIATDIARIGKTYTELEATDDESPLGLFLYRWRVMQAGVVTPVLMWLLSFSASELPRPKLERSLHALESYLIRRMVGRMTTKDYNRLFLDLLERLAEEGPAFADETVVRYLGEQTADARLWPDDRQLEADFSNLPVYRLLTRGRLRLVLEGIEDKLRTPKAESQTVPRGLTIEHVMPRYWREHWPLDIESEVEATEAAEQRDRMIHSIGNLTLVNSRLNPALSNSAWPKKRAALAEHSVLYLNKTLLDEARDQWDEGAISQRARRLAQAAASVWPAADSL